MPTLQNTLYYGDNLEVLRRYIKDETVDLIYRDPPFNSNQDYNGDSGSGMTIDLLEPIASLEEMEGSVVFPQR